MHEGLPHEALEQGRAAIQCLEIVQRGSQPLKQMEDICRQAEHELQV